MESNSSVPRETIKLQAGRRFRLPHLPGDQLPHRGRTLTYHDTADLKLAQAGIVLSRVVEAREGLWQLQLYRGSACQEVVVRGGPSALPQELRRLLFLHLQGMELGPILTLRTRRIDRTVRGLQGPLAKVSLTLVSVLEKTMVKEQFSEIAIEPIGGSDGEVEQIEATLRASGAEDADPRPTLFRVLGLATPKDTEVLPPSASTLEQLAGRLRAQVQLILAHDPGTRLGSDPEDLHQMRVATRRLRAYLRVTRPMLVQEWADTLRSELDWLGKTLGAVRDLDVMIENLRRDALNLDFVGDQGFQRLLIGLEVERDAARKAMLTSLESERYLKLVDRVKAAADAPEALPGERLFDEFAAREFKKLRKAIRSFEGQQSDQALHRIRIRCKRARYAAELAEPSVGKPAIQFLNQTKALQDLLGTHQDAVVAEQRLRQLLAKIRGVKMAFTAGRIVERAARRRRKTRGGLLKAWSKLNKRGKKAWLRVKPQAPPLSPPSGSPAEPHSPARVVLTRRPSGSEQNG